MVAPGSYILNIIDPRLVCALPLSRHEKFKHLTNKRSLQFMSGNVRRTSQQNESI